MCGFIGATPVMDIIQDDIYRLANSIYTKKHSSATKNRHVITPAGAILNYSAENGWRSPIRIKRFETKRPETRSVSDAHEEWLHIAVTGSRNEEIKRLYLLWLFRQGDRLGDTVRIKFEDIDLDNQIIYRHISKTDKRIPLPLDEEICAMLRKRNNRDGYVFPWKSKSGAYLWIKRLCKKLDMPRQWVIRQAIKEKLAKEGVA